MGWLQTIFESIVVPELARWLKARHDAGQPPPTEAEIIAKLNQDADAVIAKGEAWLKANPG